MTSIVRHLRAVLALPFVVTAVVPAWLVWRNGTSLVLGSDGGAILLQLAGLALILIGAAWFAGSIRRFAADGDGTLAPWDPPHELVVTGLYRYVRNPMITGVSLVVLGEAALLRSSPHLGWALTFIGVNAMVIPLYEEPQLVRRFGEPYREYCRNVPRLIPRRLPWTPDRSGSRGG